MQTTRNSSQNDGSFCHRAADRNRNGFTLAELLVVIATLAVLAALVLPALAGTKPNSQFFQCLNNQKQLALAWTMYSTENAGKLVGFNCKYTNLDWRIGALSAGGLPAVTATPPAGLAAGSEALYDWSIQEGYKEGALYKYAPNPGIIHCPGDKRLANSGVYYYDSYSGVMGLNGGTYNAGVGNSGVHDGATPILTRSGITHPSGRFLWVEENDTRGDNIGSWEMNWRLNYSTSTWVDCTAVYHSASSTFSFADGHVISRSWVSLTTIAGSQAGRGVYSVGPNPADVAYVASGYGCQENP